MQNVYLVLGYLGVIAGSLTLMEMLTKLRRYWKYLCAHDDGDFYGDGSRK